MKTDVYQKITDQIVTALEKGVRPWHQPWKVEHSAGASRGPCAAMVFPIRASMF